MDPQRRVARYRLNRLAEWEAEGRDESSATTADDAVVGGDGDGDGGRVGGDALPSGPSEFERPSGPRPSSMAARGAFADELVRQAMARGEFDDLPLAGKPIPGLTGRHDPDW